VIIFGERKYAMRVWLDPTKLAARQLTAADVVSALQEQNVEIPRDSLAVLPRTQSKTFRSPCASSAVYRTRKSSRASFSKHPQRIVQVKDVGRAEIGAENYDTNLMYSGHQPWASASSSSQCNALQVDKLAKAQLLELAKSFPPGIKYVIAFDTTTVVGDSVKKWSPPWKRP